MSQRLAYSVVLVSMMVGYGVGVALVVLVARLLGWLR